MKNKIIIIIIVSLVIVLILWTISLIPKKEVTRAQATGAQTALKSQNNAGNMSIAVAPADKLEVFLFHRTQRCTTCIAIGKLSGQTVDERFGPEVLSGKIVFREVNIDEPENKALADKFKASGSALFINAIRGETDDIQQDMGVWGLTGDPEVFKDYLSDKLNGLLGT